MRNLISFRLLHKEGWLYHAVPDQKTLRIMHDGKMVMVGEKSSTHQYKRNESIIEGGIMNGSAFVGVFYPGDVAVMGSSLPRCSNF
jgi:hypothetical protein